MKTANCRCGRYGKTGPHTLPLVTENDSVVLENSLAVPQEADVELSCLKNHFYNIFIWYGDMKNTYTESLYVNVHITTIHTKNVDTTHVISKG